MYKHHSDSIKAMTEKLKKREDVLAVILVGTIAQGFENEYSDIDLLIVVDDADFISRRDRYEVKLYDKEDATYVGGYIDGKYISAEYIRQVAVRGSEAARYAFKDAKIIYSKIDDLKELIEMASRYPSEGKSRKIEAFASQMIAWCWYACEAVKENNQYLLSYSVPNAILFAGRIILAVNEMLYPYHKWFMKILSEAPVKPEDMMMRIKSLLSSPSKHGLVDFSDSILEFAGIDKHKLKWTDQFVVHNEMNWLYPGTPIADI